MSMLIITTFSFLISFINTIFSYPDEYSIINGIFKITSLFDLKFKEGTFENMPIKLLSPIYPTEETSEGIYCNSISYIVNSNITKDDLSGCYSFINNRENLSDILNKIIELSQEKKIIDRIIINGDLYTFESIFSSELEELNKISHRIFLYDDNRNFSKITNSIDNSKNQIINGSGSCRVEIKFKSNKLMYIISLFMFVFSIVLLMCWIILLIYAKIRKFFHKNQIKILAILILLLIHSFCLIKILIIEKIVNGFYSLFSCISIIITKLIILNLIINFQYLILNTDLKCITICFFLIISISLNSIYLACIAKWLFEQFQFDGTINDVYTAKYFSIYQNINLNLIFFIYYFWSKRTIKKFLNRIDGLLQEYLPLLISKLKIIDIYFYSLIAYDVFYYLIYFIFWNSKNYKTFFLIDNYMDVGLTIALMVIYFPCKNSKIGRNDIIFCWFMEVMEIIKNRFIEEDRLKNIYLFDENMNEIEYFTKFLTLNKNVKNDNEYIIILNPFFNENEINNNNTQNLLNFGIANNDFNNIKIGNLI